jgi:hypothetical protein
VPVINIHLSAEVRFDAAVRVSPLSSRSFQRRSNVKSIFVTICLMSCLFSANAGSLRHARPSIASDQMRNANNSFDIPRTTAAD